MVTLDEAIRSLRTDPLYASLVLDAYLDRDVQSAAERFSDSAEWLETLQLLNNEVNGKDVLDLGAGTGIASYAFHKSGARHVYAVEPDPSDEVGCGAIRRLKLNGSIDIIGAPGEKIPLPDESIDICYARQVLHHIPDLSQALRECSRVLRSGGLFLACREHVVSDEKELAIFLKNHPVHQRAGGENAYMFDEYVGAIRSAGLNVIRIIGPWDSVINAFPHVRTHEELRQLPSLRLQRKFGRLGIILSNVPGIKAMVWKRLTRPVPGRMFSFIARKS